MTDRAIRQLEAKPPIWAMATGRPAGRHALPLLIIAAGYFVAAELGLALRFPGLYVSAIWPPNAVLLAALMLSPARYWWMILLAIVPAHVAAHADASVPVWRMGWQILHNAVLTVGAAGALRALINTRHPFHNPRDLTIYLVVAVLAAPAISSLLAPNTMSWLFDVEQPDGGAVFRAWRTTFLSNATGFLTLVPAIVLLASADWSRLRRPNPARIIEAALIMVCGYVACRIAIDWHMLVPAALYAFLPPLFWATARFGVIGAASLLFLGTLSVIDHVLDLEGIVPGGPVDQVFNVQMFLFALAVPVLILAVLVEERAETAQALEASRNELRDSHDRIQELLRKMVSAQESERARLASELHDDVGQRLSALSLGLNRLELRLSKQSGDLRKEVSRLLDAVIAAGRSVRNLSHGLHPGALQLVGLADALRGHCHEFAGVSGIEIAVDVEDDMKDVPGEVALCLFRVTQESLHNVVQHAGARRVEVKLVRRDAGIVLRIRDDGRGFDSSTQERGLGLVSLEERVVAVGGQLAVETEPGSGSTVQVDVPLASVAADD